MMTTMIPLLIPEMPDAERLLPFLRRIDANAHYTNFGPLVREFEAALLDAMAPDATSKADLCVTSMGNATVALELALQTLDLPRDAQVLLPGITFAASATAIVRSRLVPFIAEVDADAWVLTPAIAMRALQETKIEAVMPVSTFGHAHDAAEWDHFTRETGIPVLIDAAGAFGNQQPGRTTDVVYSFHATKSFGAAEGGAVMSSDRARINRIRTLSNFGIDTSIGQITEFGTNGKMSEYHAALALATFEQWPRIQRERVALHKAFVGELQQACPRVAFQQKDPEGVYPLLSVLLPQHVHAEPVARHMASTGVQTRRWYSPSLHLHPALRDAPRMQDMENATDLGNRILGIPFHLQLGQTQRSEVIAALNSALDAQGDSP